MTPVCDVVINHRTADARGVDGAWNVFADLDADGEPIHWGDWAITCDDPAFSGRARRTLAKIAVPLPTSTTPTPSSGSR